MCLPLSVCHVQAYLIVLRPTPLFRPSRTFKSKLCKDKLQRCVLYCHALVSIHA